MIPQGLLDAFNAADDAKTQADVALSAKQEAAAAVAAAEAEDEAAETELENKTIALANAKAVLDALEDAYFRVGGSAAPTA